MTFFHISVNLYGENYRGFIDRSDINLKIDGIESSSGGRTRPNLVEDFPWGPSSRKDIFPMETVKKLSTWMVFGKKELLELAGIASETEVRQLATTIVKVDGKKKPAKGAQKKVYLGFQSFYPSDQSKRVRTGVWITVGFQQNP